MQVCGGDIAKNEGIWEWLCQLKCLSLLRYDNPLRILKVNVKKKTLNRAQIWR